ncbi:Predicted kinase, aminoglycoside phosphotransferase (APT) family [Frankineae bacterium MT45]|nr:Predicted kinase, aminoglycoside phosphotransferase (APT) family [Frankineae bacterium MT45]
MSLSATVGNPPQTGQLPADVLPLDVLAPLLVAATGDAAWQQVDASLITGGKSNLTFELTCPSGAVILRRPPTGALLATAHDMSREVRVQRALAGSRVPVAQILLDDDGAAIGTPFYVMNKVAGHIIRDELPAGVADTPYARRQLGYTLVDVLAELHSVSPSEVGLAEFGRPEGFLARQLRRWGRQWEASRDEPVPALDSLAQLLEQRLPESPRPAIVHGDYRLDNCMIAPPSGDAPASVAAVLDWEMSTLGDPLTDLGMLLFYWREAGDPPRLLSPGVTSLEGFPTRREVAQRYAEQTGLDLEHLWFYEAFAHFKFAVIAQGIQARARAGLMAGQEFGDLQNEVQGIAEQGLAIAATHD